MIAEQTEPTIFAESGDLDSLIEEACRLHDEAVAAFDAGHNYKGERLFRRALAVFQADLSADHPHTVVCRENYEDAMSCIARSDSYNEVRFREVN